MTASRPRPQVRSAGSRGFAGTPGRHVEKKDGVAQGERARADGVEASKLGACTKFNWETAFVRPHVRPFLQQVFRGRRRGTRCQDARAEAERPESPTAPSGRAREAGPGPSQVGEGALNWTLKCGRTRVSGGPEAGTALWWPGGQWTVQR